MIGEERGKGGESHRRSIAKGVSYRVWGTLSTIGLAYFVTGNVNDSLSIGALEVLAKTVLYYSHERAWDKIRWGR